MSLGRPVEPPDVIAFHGFEIASGEGRVVETVDRDRLPHHDTRLRQLDDRVELARREPGRDGLRCRAELRARRSTVATNSTEFGNAIVTRSPGCTPWSCSARAVRFASDSSSRTGDGAVLVGDREMVGIGFRVVAKPLRVRDQCHERDSGAPAQRRTAAFNQRSSASASEQLGHRSRWAAIVSIVVTSHSQST